MPIHDKRTQERNEGNLWREGLWIQAHSVLCHSHKIYLKKGIIFMQLTEKISEIKTHGTGKTFYFC